MASCTPNAARKHDVHTHRLEFPELWNQRLDRLATYLDDIQQGSFRTPMPNTLTVNTPSDREIVLTREFDAPRGLVFEALSKPEHVRNWWGQADSTLVQCNMDFRPGGKWRFVERDKDGQEWGFRGELREIDPPEKIVQTFEFEGLPGHISIETMRLQDLSGGRTRVTVTSLFDSVEDRDGMLQSGMEQGAGESYDRLEAYLKTLAAATR
jgi:uncharacterized protein YndB with AHSA1/START domain